MKNERKIGYVSREEFVERIRKQFSPEYVEFFLIQMGHSPRVCPNCGNTSFTTLWLADPREFACPASHPMSCGTCSEWRTSL